MDRIRYNFMRRGIWIAMCVLAPIMAIGQTALPQQTPLEQALTSKMVAEINNTIQCSAAFIDAARQIEVLKAKIKELESK